MMLRSTILTNILRITGTDLIVKHLTWKYDLLATVLPPHSFAK